MKEKWLAWLTKGYENPGSVDLATAAFYAAAARYDFQSIEKYENHLSALCADLKKALPKKKGAQEITEAVKKVLEEAHGYQGDKDTPEDLQNNSLPHVIDRRTGGPICLAILTAHICRSNGIELDILGLPGYVLCRLSHQGERIIFDPYNGFKALEASDMRGLIKDLAGEQAELSHEYYEPLSDEEVLLRLENTTKFKQIAIEDYQGALETALIIRAFAPETLLLELELGVLYAKTEEPFRAITHLENFIEKTAEPQDRAQAVELLQSLKDRL